MMSNEIAMIARTGISLEVDGDIASAQTQKAKLQSQVEIDKMIAACDEELQWLNSILAVMDSELGL